MDRNLATKDWAKRFNLGVLCIVCVDAYHFYQQVVRADNRTTSCLGFFGRLTDKLVDNQEGIRLTWAVAEQDAGAVTDDTAAATTKVRRTIRLKPGNVNCHHQGRCSIKGCTKHFTYICSAYTYATNAAQKQFWFCNPTMVEGSGCFAKHITWHREQENRGRGK